MTIEKRNKIKDKLLKPNTRKLKGTTSRLKNKLLKRLNFIKGEIPSTRQAKRATKLQSEVKPL